MIFYLMTNFLEFVKKKGVVFIVIIIALIFHMIVIFPNGSNFCFKGNCGLYFWGASAHDGLWHLAISAVSFNKYPFILPNYTGGNLMGYNYLSDFITFLLKLIQIPSLLSYFKIIPILWFILFTFLIFKLSKKLKNSLSYLSWLLLFTYFGSGFTYFFTLFYDQTIWHSSKLLSIQSGQMMENIPYTVSLIPLLLLLIIIYKKLTIKNSFLVGLLLFIAFGFKFYAGIVCSAIVLVYLFSNLNNYKKIFLLANIFLILIWTIAAVIFFYNPFESVKSGSIFIYAPFAMVHSIIEEPYLFYLKNMTNARYYLYSVSSLLLSPRLLFIELFSTFLFLFFTLGLRIIGLFYLIFKFFTRKARYFDYVISSVLIITFLFFIFFIQKGDWWNMYQFYYYFLFFLNFATAEFFYLLTKNLKKYIIIIIIFVVLLLIIPTNIDILKDHLSFSNSVYISNAEILALQYLKKLPKGNILSPINKLDTMTLPNPISKEFDTSYVAALTEKQTYLNDLHQLNLIGIDYKERLKRMKSFDCTILEEITYVYYVKSVTDDFFNKCVVPRQKKLKKLFENNEVIIYKR